MLSLIFAATLLAIQPDASGARPTSAEAPAEASTGSAEGDDELICRRRVVDGSGAGQRTRSVRICKTRAEWDEDRRGIRRGD